MADSVVTVVTLAYGDEPLLEECVDAVLGSRGVTVEVLVVDNGCTSDAVARVEPKSGVRVLRPGHNTGFSGGCNLGAHEAAGDIIVLVNSDAVVDPGAVAALASRAADPAIGIATGSVRLMDRPMLMNTAGNPIHFTGLSWAGGLGAPATDHDRPGAVASATGCAMAVRREVWEHLGGFYEEMFAYCEDTDLSLRCWQAGWRVEYVPEAVVLHKYEFSRNQEKMYLLERNRLLMLLTVYQGSTLALLAVPLIALELAVTASAARQGWLRQKVAGWWWLLRNSRRVAARRAEVQRARRLPDSVLVPLLTAGFEPGADAGVPPAPVLNAVARGYWRLVSRFIR